MLNIYTCKTIFDGYKPLMKKLNGNRKAKNFASHIFIVPDRFSMQCEKDIFEYLGIESTFDIKVLTLSRFAGELIGSNASVLSKQASTMIIQRLLIKNKQNLKCFNKTKLNYSFAGEVFNTINQLKSSKVEPQEIVLDGNDFLAIKMQDIKLIYEQYECYLKDNNLVDSADKFTLFEKYLPEAKVLKNCAIYISHFDSFTKQGYSIVKKLIMCAGEVNISVTKSSGGLNSHIYLNDMYENIKSIAENIGKEYQEIETTEKLKDSLEHIKNNLFSYKPQQTILKDKSITLSQYDTFLTECDYVAKHIKKLINDNVRQKDIFVMCPSLNENKATIKKVFDTYDINSFFDVSTTLSDTIIDQLFSQLFALKTKYYKTEDLIAFLDNPIVGIEKEYFFEIENYLKAMQISGKSFFRDNEELNALRKKISVYIDFLAGVKNQDSYKGYVQAYKGLFERINLEDILSSLSVKYYQKGYLKEAKITEQFYSKTLNLLTTIEDIFGNLECDLFEFFDIIKSGLDSLSVSTTPVSVDGVFVGDASKSLIGRPKYLFVTGAKEGALPYTLSDCGMITDREINKMSMLYKLEPTVNTINLRERFKLFNLLLLPTEALYISYSKGQGNISPAGFFEQLKNMFVINGRNGIQTIEIEDADYNFLNFSEKLGCKKSAQKILSERLRNIEDGILYSCPEETGSLLELLRKDTAYLKDYKNITNYKKCNKLSKNIFFGSGTISVSQIERYYSCPFKHFLDYGLKLKENKVVSFDTIEVGNFLHKIAECFVERNLNKLPLEGDFENVVDSVFEQVMQEEEFCQISQNDNNSLAMLSIKKESYRMCNAINYQIKKSNFRPTLTEARFDDFGKIKSLKIKVKDKCLKIVGAIDRIDVCKDYFRIIDYKTGRCDSSLKELYYGKKLQLYVYQAVVNDSLKLKPAGAYYFPVKNSFVSSGESKYSSYKLKGYTVESEDVILDSDIDLNVNKTSDIINVLRKKDMSLSSKSETLSQEGVVTLAEYAMAMLKQGASEIISGNITASPFVIDGRSACEFCKYKSICRYDETLGDKSRMGIGSVDIDVLKESLCGKD